MESISPGTGSEPSAGATENHSYFRSSSPAVQAVERVISEIARTDIPVLLLGESGSGKEVIATRIHQFSQRSHEPLIKIRCATYTRDILERRQAAESGEDGQTHEPKGSVFLDDVAELDLACQSKLLALLPDGESAPPDCLARRVISATSRNLEEEMIAGRFREELYYRINGVSLRLPPLRQRKEDIPGLVNFFLKKYEAHFGHAAPRISRQSLAILTEHNWPGNIRELENTIRKMVALGEDGAALADLTSAAADVRAGNGGTHTAISLKEAAKAASHLAERELILKVLARTRWNRKRAAKELQISYKAFLYKLKQIGVEELAGSLSPRGEQG